ncbi:MAG: zinc metalloprotease HtpX [Candidatus Omnitrophota bacterium]
MALTYTEIEQQKNTRILFFFAVVVLFYFVVAVVLASVAKVFFSTEIYGRGTFLLSGRQLLYVLVFALVAAVLHSAYSVHHAFAFISGNLQATGIDPTDAHHQRFKKVLDEVNVATGNRCTLTPVVIPTVAMNAFAISNRKREALVGITEGLLSRLTRPQLLAVVAHEVAHVVSGDSFQATIGCALFGIYAAMLSGIGKTFRGGRIRVSGRGGAGVLLFILLIYVLLSVLQFFYNLIRLFVSRDRELRADAIAVKLTRDPISLSEALYIIGRRWRGLGVLDRSLESLFIINPIQEERDESEGLWADLLSTHPPIRKRIVLLAQMAHTDARDIEAGVLQQEKIRETFRKTGPREAEMRWMALEQEKGWRGPLTVTQLLHLDWLRPDSWLKGVGEEAMKQAKDEPSLKPFFDGQIQAPNVSSWKCPHCQQSLVEEAYEGALVWRCVFCEGVLMDEAKTGRIVIRREKTFSERIQKLADLTQRNSLDVLREKPRRTSLFHLGCPRCGNKMVRNFYTMAYLVEVDRCYACQFIWFDKDELEIVQAMIERTQLL